MPGKTNLPRAQDYLQWWHCPTPAAGCRWRRRLRRALPPTSFLVLQQRPPLSRRRRRRNPTKNCWAELLHPPGPDQRRRAARTGAKSRSPIDVWAPSSLPLAGNRIGGDGGSRRSSRRSGSLRVRTKRLSGKRSKCPGATWGRHESDAAARTAGGNR